MSRAKQPASGSRRRFAPKLDATSHLSFRNAGWLIAIRRTLGTCTPSGLAARTNVTAPEQDHRASVSARNRITLVVQAHQPTLSCPMRRPTTHERQRPQHPIFDQFYLWRREHISKRCDVRYFMPFASTREHRNYLSERW